MSARRWLGRRTQGMRRGGVKRLLVAHGAGRLSELDPAEYPALLAEAEEL